MDLGARDASRIGVYAVRSLCCSSLHVKHGGELGRVELNELTENHRAAEIREHLLML